MNEPRCHEHGLFSIHSVAYNAYHMLFEGFIESDRFPFMQPTPWGCIHFPRQPVLVPSFPRGRQIQGRGVDRNRLSDGGAVVPLQSGRLAVFLPLRHDAAAVDVPFAGRQRAEAAYCERGRAVRSVSCNQRCRRLAIPMDKPDTRMKRTRLPRMSPKRRREQAKTCAKVFLQL